MLGFRSSDNLGAAYGIAVTGTMTVTTILAFVYMVGVKGWSPVAVLPLFGFFLTVDLVVLRRQPAEDRAGRLVPADRRADGLYR